MIKKVIKFFKRPLLLIMKLYWRIFRPETFGVKVILTHDNEILLVMHTYGFKYNFPGGLIKKSEDKIEACKRELFEELNIKIRDLKYVGLLTSTRYYKKDNIYIYTSGLQDKSFKLDKIEIDSAGWFNINNLPLLSPTTQEIYNLYTADKK